MRVTTADAKTLAELLGNLRPGWNLRITAPAPMPSTKLMDYDVVFVEIHGNGMKVALPAAPGTPDVEHWLPLEIVTAIHLY